jgi:hypothetical protein
LLPNLKENLLQDFLSFQGIVENVNREGVKKARVTVIQFAKGFNLALRDSAEQLNIQQRRIFKHPARVSGSGVWLPVMRDSYP